MATSTFDDKGEAPVRFDDYDDCIIGHGMVWHPDGDRRLRVIYSGEKILEKVMAAGLTEEEALEHIDFNMEGAYVGPETPIVVWPIPEDWEED